MLAICLLKFAKHIIVHLIYFCQSADFKLHRKKVQSWKLRFAVMENSDTEFGKTIEEVSLILQHMCPKKGSSRLGP